MLERSAVKVASCVLMGEGSREAPDLPDHDRHVISSLACTREDSANLRLPPIPPDSTFSTSSRVTPAIRDNYDCNHVRTLLASYYRPRLDLVKREYDSGILV